jgi:hypothetical protein
MKTKRYNLILLLSMALLPTVFIYWCWQTPRHSEGFLRSQILMYHEKHKEWPKERSQLKVDPGPKVLRIELLKSSPDSAQYRISSTNLFFVEKDFHVRVQVRK